MTISTLTMIRWEKRHFTRNLFSWRVAFTLFFLLPGLWRRSSAGKEKARAEETERGNSWEKSGHAEETQSGEKTKRKSQRKCQKEEYLGGKHRRRRETQTCSQKVYFCVYKHLGLSSIHFFVFTGLKMKRVLLKLLPKNQLRRRRKTHGKVEVN